MKNTISLLTIFFSVATFGYSQTTPAETPLPSVGAPSNTVEYDRSADNPRGIPSRNPDGFYDKYGKGKQDLSKGSRESLTNIINESSSLTRFHNSTKVFKTFRITAPASYQNEFAQLLKNKKYKLASIASIDPKCYKAQVMSVKDYEDCENALAIWGGGSSYSFRNDSNFDDKRSSISDIRILNNRFEVGDRFTQGIISELGNVELETVNLKSAELQYLVNFKPEKDYREVVKQRASLAKGVTSNGFFYSIEAPIKLNSTYLVRSIAYDPTKSTWDNRKDLIVVFKVVGIESDDSVVILWKELKKSKSPWLKCKYMKNGKCW